MTNLATHPEAILRHSEALPFVSFGEGNSLQLLQVDLAAGVWTVRAQFSAGLTVQTHRHTGAVHAFTNAGSWHYLEYPNDINLPGSYLFEPAGSVHTLHVPASNTEITDIWFIINGANLNLDTDGNIVSVSDAHSVLARYRAACAEQHGLADPPVVVFGG